MATPNLNWERLARAETHPLRIKILELVARASQPCSPNQISKTFDESLGVVSYHVKELREAGFIELAKTEPRRGAVEHFYAATKDAYA